MGKYTNLRSYGIRIDQCNNKGLTIKAIADRLGITRQQVHNLINGSRRCHIKTLGQVAEVLECSPVDLLPIEFLDSIGKFNRELLKECFEVVMRTAHETNHLDSEFMGKLFEIVFEIYQIASDLGSLPDKSVVKLVIKSTCSH